MLRNLQHQKLNMHETTTGFGKSKTDQERQEHMLRTSQLKSEYNNPCIKEQEMSYKCLSDNGYDREKCSLQFANYKGCKEFWNRVRSDRRSKGIYPYLPVPEEREKIREEYMRSKGK
ncbi:coiled-coil-helix-coiled-coil-helix domain-containing protein 7 isoform X2 [Anabrus simplex]|uniref:coiled-coil-helix-coiled-coil-helix domain-containing protein 7 isoform X2 n=1 Tax=Anabrus simplex TaxID=316456 RepID=UPI0035A31A13